MLSGPVLKQFRTYLKSQVGNGWSVEGRKSKGRLLTRVSFRYLSGERSVVLLDIDFDADNQDDILRIVKKLSDLMRERNIELFKAKELQADCFEGKHVSLFHSDLNKSSIFSLAKLILHIGGPNHGEGSQRAFALFTGAGIIEGNCEDESMKKLARNKKLAEKKIKKLMKDFDIKNKSLSKNF